MDLLSHFVAIQESMKKIRQYEKEEKRKDIIYHIKKLPNEMTRHIFSYLSLIPFDKQEFKDYFKYKAPFYKQFTNGSHTYNRFNISFLVCYDIRHPRGIVNPYEGQSRMTDTIYKWDFHTTKPRKIKGINGKNHNHTRQRFMYPLIAYYQNKNVLKELIKCEMNKHDIEKAVKKTNPSSAFVCRMKYNELDKLYKTMVLAKD